MNTLIIYDSTGYILDVKSGGIREPIGVPFIWVEIPVGKRLKTTIDGLALIDVTVTPNVAILEDIPKTETELLQIDQAFQVERLRQIELDAMAFQDYVLSVLPQ